MDDKNKEIIDFSNQPLGLMAQEGARIEEKNNNEYRLNEAARNIGNQQVNPFENIELQKRGNNKFFGNVNNMQNNQTPQFNQNMNNQNNMFAPSNQMSNPVPSMINPQINQNIQMSPSDQNIQINQINQNVSDNQIQSGVDIVQSTNYNSNDKEIINNPDEQPGSWGIFVFIIFVLIVVGAIYLFNSGKLDSLLNDESSENVEKISNNENNEEENNQSNVVEIINNVSVKETIYISVENVSTYVTSQGVIDFVNKTGKFSENVTINGVISRNVDYYIDYVSKLIYIQDINDSSKWIKEKLSDTVDLNVDLRIEQFEKEYSFKEVSTNNYKLEIPGSYYESLYSNPENIPKYINKKNNIVLEYTKKDGHVVKTRYDLTNVVKDVNKYYIVQEISNINGNGEIIIPKSILNTK